VIAGIPVADSPKEFAEVPYTELARLVVGIAMLL